MRPMEKTINEYDAVVLLNDLAGTPLVAGDTGVVVYVHGNGTCTREDGQAQAIL